VKIRSVAINNRKARLELTVHSGKMYPMPYSRLDPSPTTMNRMRRANVDRELGGEAVTYVLESGDEGTVHIEQALDYNQDPGYLGEVLIHKLTVEARKRIEDAGLSRREIARRLHTSVPQLYRLLDPANTHKSISQMVSLLHVLDCDVDLVVRARRDVTTDEDQDAR
jgi:hypothetical protein